MDPIYRHLAACNDAVLPGSRLPFAIGGQQAGWIDPALRAPLLHHGAYPFQQGVTVAPPHLHGLSRKLADLGHYAWRGEPFDIRATPEGPVLAQLDRGALPTFGARAEGVHLNALVMRGDAPWLWVARRARTKLLDPGKLDHLVAGGIPAGLGPIEALAKEAEEEAGLSQSLLTSVRPVGIVQYAMERPEGLRRDRLHCFDVVLPQSFRPEPRDGEVESFELWPVQDVLHRVRTTDDFKFNVNLVLIGLFERLGLLPQPTSGDPDSIGIDRASTG